MFDAAIRFSRCEGILPAPESSHAIYAAIEEALKCKASGEAKTILFGLTGTGYFDMAAYASYFDRTMSDSIPTDEQLEKRLSGPPEGSGIIGSEFYCYRIVYEKASCIRNGASDTGFFLNRKKFSDRRVIDGNAFICYDSVESCRPAHRTIVYYFEKPFSIQNLGTAGEKGRR